MSKDGCISNNFTRYPSQVSSQRGPKTTTCAARKHKNGTVSIFQEFYPIFCGSEGEIRVMESCHYDLEQDCSISFGEQLV